MPVRLTETAIRAALMKAASTGQRRDLADAGQDGLRLRVTPGGAASWVLACRDRHGRMRRFPLGGWPALGLADAREKARALRVSVRDGADPIAEARKMRAIGRDARAGIGTLGALLDLYGGPVAKPGDAPADAPKPRAIGPGRDRKTWPEMRRKVETVFAELLRRPLVTLTAGDFQMAADAYPSKASASAAVRYVRPILKWAARRGYVAREAALIDPPAPVRRRERVLTREELAALLPALAGGDPFRRALMFMLLTLCRRDEAAEARWRDVDLDAAEWRIAETKNGRPHRVPLSRQAVALLRAIGPGAPDARVFATSGGGKLANWDRATKRLMRETGTAGWTRHDLRRTGATLLGEMGVEPHVIEAALNHASVHSPLAAVYNRARYGAEVGRALQMLADRLDGIAAGGAAVVPLARRR
ncbi:MAG: site-specific integrase [Roseococcus sp.]|nr:site-specific integrase [Roseococcus sp.]